MILPLLALLAADATQASPPPPSAEDRAAIAFHRGATDTALRRAIDASYPQLVEDLVTLTQTAAPTFAEADRARLFATLLSQAGLAGVTTDAAGNVVGLRKGRGHGLIVVAAHLDTVFDKDVDVTVKRDGDTLRAPGIADDTLGLAVLVAYVRALDAAKVHTDADLLFVGTVGEEQLGNIRGARHLVGKGDYAGRITGFVGFEPARPGQMVVTGIGSRRFAIRFTGPGGHSFGDFGTVNPAYPLAALIRDIAGIVPPPDTRTTYNVGLLSGGTSVNAIPAQVSATIDVRSDTQSAIDVVEQQIRAAVPKAVAVENAARSTAKGRIAADITLVGDRPAGRTAPDSPLVRRAAAALRAAGLTPMLDAQSTDANAAMERGIPAIVIGPGFEAGGGHSPTEWLKLNRTKDVDAMTAALAAIIAAASR